MALLPLLLGGLIGGVANRFSGYTNIKFLPGRNVYYAALVVLAVACWYAGSFLGFITFLSFCLYRLPGWYNSIDAGTHEGTVMEDFLIMFLRGLCFAPIFIVMSVIHPSALPILLLVLAAVNGAHAYYFANHNKHLQINGDPMWYAETKAGFVFGLFVAVILQA